MVIMGLALSYFVVLRILGNKVETVMNRDHVGYVANRKIPPGVIMGYGDFVEAELPEYVNRANYVHNIEEMIGRTTVREIPKGAFIEKADVSFDQRFIPDVATLIPEGYRAVTMGIDDERAVGGRLRNGDHVDIVLINESQVTVLMENVWVLAVHRGPGEEGIPGPIVAVTFAVEPSRVTSLLSLRAQGSFWLALRQREDESTRVNQLRSIYHSDTLGVYGARIFKGGNLVGETPMQVDINRLMENKNTDQKKKDEKEKKVEK